ncbi:unnamed protein product, partial [marine sediment metagenome]
MLTAIELRAAYDEADVLATGKPKAKYIKWLERAWVFLIPAKDDDLPVLCRCRCCGSVCLTALGPEGHVPDSNLHLKLSVPSPCGYCRPILLPRMQTLLGVRERHKAGQPLGIG